MFAFLLEEKKKCTSPKWHTGYVFQKECKVACESSTSQDGSESQVLAHDFENFI